MSLPVTRRIARAALLIAAGTAPVVGAAGSASALEMPAKAPGMSNQDTSKSVEDGARAAVGATNALAKGTVTNIVPAIVYTAGPTVKALHPITQKGTDTTGTIVKRTAKPAVRRAIHKGMAASMTARRQMPAPGGLLGGLVMAGPLGGQPAGAPMPASGPMGH